MIISWSYQTRKNKPLSSKMIKFYLCACVLILEKEHSIILSKDFLLHVRFELPDVIQELNQRFRQKSYIPNVLTFVYDDKSADIVFCAKIIEEQAYSWSKDLLHHQVHLLIHSLLHILGFDHELPSQAKDMERLEVLLLNTLGFSNPYLLSDDGVDINNLD